MRLLHRSRGAVRSWTVWSMRQHVAVRLVIGVGGLAVLAGAGFTSWYVIQLV